MVKLLDICFDDHYNRATSLRRESLNQTRRIVALEAEVLYYKRLVADMTATLDDTATKIGYEGLPPAVALEVVKSNILEFPLERIACGG